MGNNNKNMGNKCCCSDRHKSEKSLDREDKDVDFDEQDDLLNGVAEPADEPAPEPIAEPVAEPADIAAQASVADMSAPDTGAQEPSNEPVVRSYLVDNSQLQAETVGLNYRQSKQVDDKHDILAEWGCIVKGKDAGDGWVEIPDDNLNLFLPMELRGVPVLILHTEGEDSFGFSGLSSMFLADDIIDDGEEDEEEEAEDEQTIEGQDQGDILGFGNLFGTGDGSDGGEASAEQDDASDRGDVSADQDDILGFGSLFGSGNDGEEVDAGGQEQSLRDPAAIASPGSSTEGWKGEDQQAVKRQSAWDLMFGSNEPGEKQGEKGRRKKNKKIKALQSDEAGASEVTLVSSKNAVEEQEDETVQPPILVSNQQAASSSDHWPASVDVQSAKSNDKDSLRAALKDAADARDVDKLQSALRDAVDGGVGAKDLGKAWNVLADEQRKTAADEERKSRALQALTVATELRQKEKIQAALQEGRDAGLKEAFLKPARAVLKDLEVKERKKKTESQNTARTAIRELMTGRRGTALLLQQAIQRAEEAGLQADEISQARELLSEKMAATRNRLAKAVMDRNLDELRASLKEGEEAGLSPEYLSHGQQLLPKLEKKAAAHATLAKAAAGNNVEVLQRALAEGEEAGLEESVLATARTVLNLQKERADFAEKEEQKLEARKALQAAMSEQDIIDLRSAIEAAEKAGIDDAEELKAARVLLAKETEKLVARRTLDATDLDVVKIFANSQAAAALPARHVPGNGGRTNILLPSSKGSSAPGSKATSLSPAGSKGPSLRAWGQKRSQTPTGAHTAKPRLRSSSRVSVSRRGSEAPPEASASSARSARKEEPGSKLSSPQSGGADVAAGAHVESIGKQRLADADSSGSAPQASVSDAVVGELEDKHAWVGDETF